MFCLVNYDIGVLVNLQTKELRLTKNSYKLLKHVGEVMISEQIFYLFLFPWIIFIATIPGSVVTYLFAGLAAQLLNYLPESKEGDD